MADANRGEKAYGRIKALAEYAALRDTVTNRKPNEITIGLIRGLKYYIMMINRRALFWPEVQAEVADLVNDPEFDFFMDLITQAFDRHCKDNEEEE